MDNNSENEHNERRNSNTEYLPTKCRITKPPPPKPATNPLQFVKVAPCPLFQKAHEQIKKVEEIKKERKEIREEAEDWQQNLDNWKSSRRKRQEHIIERVVEVKKLEQEEQERNRRKSKTFNEMIEDRSRGRHKFSIPILDDDSNDLSDYGIGSSSSKTNSVKDFDTDDSSSLLDEKDHRLLESPCNNKENSNQSQSEDETISKVDKTNQQQEFKTKLETNKSYNDKQETIEQYTYEGAIQDYRTRIRSKIHVDESIFTKTQDFNNKSKEYNEAQSALPKGEIYKRKELFELDKQIDINTCETNNTTRRLSEDFVNTQSIKQRLQSLEKCVETPLKAVDKYDLSLVKQRLQNFNNKQNDNSNINKNNNNPPKISNYLLEKKNDINVNNKNINQTDIEWKKKDITSERCSSPETELYMDKLNTFSKDLDNLMYGKTTGNLNNLLDDYVINQNYPPSTSSTELTCLSSDREDSGIHTADVSCSVSQADEPVEDFVTTTTTTITNKKIIPNINDNYNSIEMKNNHENNPESKNTVDIVNNNCNNNIDRNIIKETENLLQNLREDSSNHLIKKPSVLYENINFNNQTPIEFIGDIDPLAPPKIIEPPNKPPPPPPPIDDNIDNDDNNKIDNNMQRMNSTKRIKREIYIKRSSFLGLDETLNNDEINTIININKPPDVTKFLQKEQKLEKTLYKKTQEDNRIGLLSKVSSHDSGLEIDRGRLSSDTWCSSIGDSNTPSPERQDSEQMNSITSEEDEIMKKEREIIEMVEKEEKSRDNVDYKDYNENHRNQQDESNVKYLENCYNTETSNYLDEQDSEVLKVEQELRMLEREELERQRDVRLFESNRKIYLQNNRRSLDNILDEIYPVYQDGVNYRKSVPELQHIPLEYRKSLPDVPNIYNIYTENRNLPDVDLQYRKSMPDIQNAYKKCDYRQTLNDNNVKLPLEHRKSMPDVSIKSPPPLKRQQPIMPGKPLRPLSKEQKECFFMMNNTNDTTLCTNKQQLTRNSLQALSAVPKSRHLQPNNWIHPRNETKNYNQHWLYQEAELRRIAEQQKNAATNRNNPQRQRQEKHLPDSIIQSLTQRVQNRNELNDRNPPPIRSPNRQNQSGHALPIPYSTQMTTDESQDRILSVSGKKKCSYCNNELGRGAAMIIESLCLFYHMECFKCCVCHMQLSDGLMGTDVRVRNQKLHCHNCYSSDDGVKFSCV